MDVPIEVSKLIARIAAIVYISLGLGLFLNKDYYRKGLEKLLDNFIFIFINGTLLTVIGYIIVEKHSYWGLSFFSDDWPVLVTVFGYVTLVKGIILLIFPKITKLFKQLFKLKNIDKILTVVMLIFGGVMAYFGFVYD